MGYAAHCRYVAAALPVCCRRRLWDFMGCGAGSHGAIMGKAAPEGRLSTYKARCGTNAGVSQPRTSFLCRRCGRAASSPRRVDLVLLVGLEVALEPVPLGRVVVVAFPREDMRGDAVEEPYGRGKSPRRSQGIRAARLRADSKVSTSRSLVGSSSSSRLPPCFRVRARFRRLRSPPESTPVRLLLVGALEAEAGHIGAGRHLGHAGHLDEVEAAGHGFPQVLVRVEALTVLVDVADLDGVADLQLAARSAAPGPRWS